MKDLTGSDHQTLASKLPALRDEHLVKATRSSEFASNSIFKVWKKKKNWSQTHGHHYLWSTKFRQLCSYKSCILKPSSLVNAQRGVGNFDKSTTHVFKKSFIPSP